ncbi:MAG: uracil-DNA glycosylase [Desulfurococcales archaeon]|nr:uracil-DNA glycosylase [Desulfurococcales archaeon]
MEQRLRLHHNLVREIMVCTLCRLHEARKNPVPGEGPIPSRVMIVGEAPGRKEDEAGRPFVGQAGRLLDKLLALANLSRSEVYITNVVKCRPPGNRDPRHDEIAACMSYLSRQIQLVEPEIIMAVGRIAGATLYRMAGLRWRGIRADRGKLVYGTIAGRKVGIYATFHPAAALYNREILPLLEDDFRRLGDILRGNKGRSLLDFL